MGDDDTQLGRVLITMGDDGTWLGQVPVTLEDDSTWLIWVLDNTRGDKCLVSLNTCYYIWC